MANPSFVGAGTFTSGTGALTVPWPAGYADGDTAFLVISSANESQNATVGDGSFIYDGWYIASAESPATAGAVDLVVYIYENISGTQTSVSVGDAGSYTAARIFVVRPGSTETLRLRATPTVDASATTAVSTPAFAADVSIPNAFVLAFIGLDKDLTSTNTITGTWVNSSLTSITERSDDTTSSGVGGGIAAVSGVRTTQGGLGVFTNTADSSTKRAYVTYAIYLVPFESRTTAAFTATARLTGGTIAPPQVVSSSSLQASATTLSISTPSNYRAGDILVVHIVSDGTSWGFWSNGPDDGVDLAVLAIGGTYSRVLASTTLFTPTTIELSGPGDHTFVAASVHVVRYSGMGNINAAGTYTTPAGYDFITPAGTVEQRASALAMHFITHPTDADGSGYLSSISNPYISSFTTHVDASTATGAGAGVIVASGVQSEPRIPALGSGSCTVSTLRSIACAWFDISYDPLLEQNIYAVSTTTAALTTAPQAMFSAEAACVAVSVGFLADVGSLLAPWGVVSESTATADLTIIPVLWVGYSASISSAAATTAPASHALTTLLPAGMAYPAWYPPDRLKACVSADTQNGVSVLVGYNYLNPADTQVSAWTQYATMYSEESNTYADFVLPSNNAWRNVRAVNDSLYVLLEFLNGTGLDVSQIGGYYTATGSNFRFHAGHVHTVTLPFEAQWCDLAYGNLVYVAIAKSINDVDTNQYATSTDRINWTTRTLPISGCQQCCFVAGRFVISGYTSTNGISWTSNATILTSHYMRVSGGVLFTDNQTYSRTADGLNWDSDLYSTHNVAAIEMTDGGFVHVRSDITPFPNAFGTGPVPQYSHDGGVTWLSMLTTDYGNFHNGGGAAYAGRNRVLVAAWHPDYVVTVWEVPPVIYYCDSMTWERPLDYGAVARGFNASRATALLDPRAILTTPLNGSAQSVATFENVCLLYSEIGIRWGFRFGGRYKTSTGSYNDYYPTATHIINKTGATTCAVSSGMDAQVSGIYTCPDVLVDARCVRMVVVGYTNYAVQYSYDGITWTTAYTHSDLIKNIRYVNGMWVVFAWSTDAAAWSTDGINWTAFTLPWPDCKDVAFAGSDYFFDADWNSDNYPEYGYAGTFLTSSWQTELGSYWAKKISWVRDWSGGERTLAVKYDTENLAFTLMRSSAGVWAQAYTDHGDATQTPVFGGDVIDDACYLGPAGGDTYGPQYVWYSANGINWSNTAPLPYGTIWQSRLMYDTTGRTFVLGRNPGEYVERTQEIIFGRGSKARGRLTSAIPTIVGRSVGEAYGVSTLSVLIQFGAIKAATATAAGALDTQIYLAGGVTSEASVITASFGAIMLGASDAQSTGVADLTAQITLAANPACTALSRLAPDTLKIYADPVYTYCYSWATGELVTGVFFLPSIAEAFSTARGYLATRQPFDAPLRTAESTASGALTVRNPLTADQLYCASTTSGVVTTNFNLTSAPAAICSAAGTTLMLPKPVSGACEATTGSSGELLIRKPLEAAVSGRCAATASLTRRVEYASSTTARSVCSGGVLTAIPLQGAAAVSFTSVVYVEAAGRFQSLTISTSNAVGLMDTGIPLAGIATAQVIVTGDADFLIIGEPYPRATTYTAARAIQTFTSDAILSVITGDTSRRR